MTGKSFCSVLFCFLLGVLPHFIGSIPQRVARSQPQPEDSASSNWASASPYLEVAPDKLGHGVVVDVQGQRDPGLSLKPGSPHGGHPGHLARPEACGQRRP